MELCGSCGAIALSTERAGATRCGVCEAGLAGARKRAGPLADDLVVVGVRCRFQCRGCGHMAPLDQLDVDGTVRCARCGLEQAFDVESWEETLAFAHAVGDLAGPEPEGRFPDPHFSIALQNPYRAIGVTQIWDTHALTGEVQRGAAVLQRSLEVRAHPGRPLCTCGAPLDLRRLSVDSVESVCAACGRRNTSRLDRRAGGLNHALRATFSAMSAPPDATRGLTGSLGFSCPGCGAPLRVSPGDALATCPFCKLSSRVSVGATGGTGEDRPPAVWWLVFEGASFERARVTREGVEVSDDPAEIRSPPEVQPQGALAALRLTAGWLFPAGAMFISALIILAMLMATKG